MNWNKALVGFEISCLRNIIEEKTNSYWAASVVQVSYTQYINSFNLYNNLFLQMKNEIDRLSNLPRVTQPLNNGARI